MNTTDKVAWIGAVTGSVGAITGSIALIWEIYKWRRSGPRLKIKVKPNVIQGLSGVKTIAHYLNLMITASNEGQSQTEITRVELTFYPTRWKKLRGTPTWFEPARVLNLPYLVMPGSQWTSLPIRQTDEFVDMSKRGYFCCLVFHAAKAKPVTARIVIPDHDYSSDVYQPLA